MQTLWLWLIIGVAAVFALWMAMAVGSALYLMQQVEPLTPWAEKTQLGSMVRVLTKRVYWILGILAGYIVTASFKSGDFGRGLNTTGWVLFFLLADMWLRVMWSCRQLAKARDGIGVWPLTRLPKWRGLQRYRHQTANEIAGLLGVLGILIAGLYIQALLELSYRVRNL